MSTRENGAIKPKVIVRRGCVSEVVKRGGIGQHRCPGAEIGRALQDVALAARAGDSEPKLAVRQPRFACRARDSHFLIAFQAGT